MNNYAWIGLFMLLGESVALVLWLLSKRVKPTWRDRLDEMVDGYGPYLPQTAEIRGDLTPEEFGPGALLAVSLNLASGRPARGGEPRPVKYNYHGVQFEEQGSRVRVITDKARNHGRTFNSFDEAYQYALEELTKP